MINKILAFLITTISISLHAGDKDPHWERKNIEEVSFLIPANARINSFKHDEGIVVSVFPFDKTRGRLEIRIESTGCVLPMYKMFTDDNNQIGFESKYDVGTMRRCDAVLISKNSNVICKIQYSDVLPDVAMVMDKIIKSIQINK